MVDVITQEDSVRILQASGIASFLLVLQGKGRELPLPRAEVMQARTAEPNGQGTMGNEKGVAYNYHTPGRSIHCSFRWEMKALFEFTIYLDIN